MSEKAIHFPGLNGLRAIAALAVVFAHFIPELGLFGLDPYVLGVQTSGKPVTTKLAVYGVSMFFSLSGFLITYLLLEEKTRAEVDVKKFYIRRILRIWPLYYVYLAIVLTTLFWLQFPVQGWVLACYVLLAANVPFSFGMFPMYLGHYWSLGVEEQFYAFWPWIVKRADKLFRVTCLLCGILLLLKLGLRALDALGGIQWPYVFLQTTRFHCMLIGAIGAILYHQKHTLFLRLTTHVLSQALAWLVIALVAANRFHIASVLDNELVSVVTVLLILGQIESKHKLLNLDNAIFDWVGKISYGIYVLHPLLIFLLSKVLPKPAEPTWYAYLWVSAVVFGSILIAAHLSYQLLEKRFILMKDRFSVVKSAASKL
jgi:peptidoglycan/LPS O-acetylase OafA/YrhL